jgi:NAD-dependent SIR2 family protein deacetylase
MTPAETHFDRAAAAIRSAHGLLIGAGAGMGVDSGLPDFRGNDGFWNAYPAFRDRGLSFEDMANPSWFDRDPAQAWGFYGHRLALYRKIEPHEGFGLLRELGERLPSGAFAFTSNVDGHFERAGFDPGRVIECHGSIHHLQCSVPCTRAIWPADEVDLEVDEERCRASGELPRCPRCGVVARPNILMFDDDRWIGDRTEEQASRYGRWLARIPRERLVAMEFGAGLAVPTVRYECERRAGRLIRVNPRDPEAPGDGISLAVGALLAIREIAARYSDASSSSG